MHRWRKRSVAMDLWRTPHCLQGVLTPALEAVLVPLRQALLRSLNDLLVTVREFINPAVSRSGLHRCLRRHEAASLHDLIPKLEDKATPNKSFKGYEPGVFHMVI